MLKSKRYLRKGIAPLGILQSLDSSQVICGETINMNSQSYTLFKSKGVKCKHCGIEGKFCGIEKHKKYREYKIKVYALTQNNTEILMTVDHIIPLSRGGTDTLENLQPLCEICNRSKGNYLESELKNRFNENNFKIRKIGKHHD